MGRAFPPHFLCLSEHTAMRSPGLTSLPSPALRYNPKLQHNDYQSHLDPTGLGTLVLSTVHSWEHQCELKLMQCKPNLFMTMCSHEDFPFAGCFQKSLVQWCFFLGFPPSLYYHSASAQLLNCDLISCLCDPDISILLQCWRVQRKPRGSWNPTVNEEKLSWQEKWSHRLVRIY